MNKIKSSLKSVGIVNRSYQYIKRIIYFSQNLSKYFNLWVAPGHYYSPIPDRELIENQLPSLLDGAQADISGINLNLTTQNELFKSLSKHIAKMDYPAHKSTNRRYFYENDMYAYGDATALFCILQHYKPQTIIEVGSGYSTALMLDYREQFDSSLDIISIEPHPERLLNQLKPGDLDNNLTLMRKRLEEVDVKVFNKLKQNDILFIDSSHVSKLGSDVNYYLFNVLPKLNRGALIHIHDISWPFEYNRELINEGRFWNESYIIRAFLQFNDSFEIIFWPSQLKTVHPKLLKQYNNFNNKQFGPGASIWLRKTK